MNHEVAATQPANPWPRLGVGAMPLSFEHYADEAELQSRIDVLHAAFDAGMTVVDTADIYAPDDDSVGHNESVVGEAVRRWPGGRENLFILTKNGLRREGGNWWRDSSPAWLLEAAQRSCEALGMVPDCIAIHRVNREQPWHECIEGLMAARDAGYTRSIGLSNVTLDELNSAWEISGGSIVVVENEYSPRMRDGIEVMHRCAELGVAYLPWSPLGGGREAGQLGDLYPNFELVAARHDTNAQAVALAWLAQQAERVIPIPGFSRIASVQSAAAALALNLSEADMRLLSSTPAGAGSVFPGL